MGIDHVVDLECAAKDGLGGVEALVQLVKARARGEGVLRMAREQGDTRDPREITFQVQVLRPRGREITDVSVQALLDQAAPLDRARGACASCPANGGSDAGFGCYDRVSYPIELETERLLLDRLPASLASTAGQFLTRALADFGWDGAQAARMRAESDMFFVAKTAPRREWPELTITGDQVFHMLFHVGHLGSTHAFMCALFFGVVPHDLDPAILSHPARRAQLLSLAAVPRATGQIEQISSFLRALARAAQLDSQLLIDG